MLLLSSLCLPISAGSGRRRSPYETLGLSKDKATPEEVKRAYKKLALKWHPDRQRSATDTQRKAAEAKFKEVAEAYDTLSDPEKKRVYDQYGEAGLKAREQGADFSSPFGDHPAGAGGFPASAPFGGMGGGPGRTAFRFSFGNSPMQGGLEELLASLFTGPGGASHGINLGDMFGSFAANSGFGAPKRRSPRRGRAQGAIHKRDLVCTLEQLYAGCTKRLRISERGRTNEVAIPVPPGTRPGTQLSSPAAKGIVFVVRAARHPWFELDGSDLIWRCRLTQAQARARKGVRLRVPTLDGRELEVSTKGMRIRNGLRHVVPGEGMPLPRGDGARGKAAAAAKHRGDLVIVFSLKRKD